MRISIYHILLLFSFIIILNQNLLAQLVVDDTATPEELVENMVDESIIYSDIIYFGDTISSGIFTTIDTTDLGMEEGIILTTGDAILAIGPNNDPLASSDNSLPGHPLLTQLYGTYSRDACGLDFNFMSNNDLLICKTIFGSEEYPGYINIDEGFGIFISGSKPEGGNYADTNIANIPNTCIPINVNNINNVIPSFPEYYVDNTNGQYIQYNGFTVVIEVYIYLFPDSTYNAKILTADLADRYYDSGVFIEKNSFKSVSSTELLSFNFQALINPGLSEDYTGIIINDSVFVSLPFSTDLTLLVASFTNYPGTSVYIDAVLQSSDTTINDFTEPVIYNLLAGNGNSKEWTVVVDYLPNNEHQIIEYSFLAENNPNLWGDCLAEIDGQNIQINIPEETDISNLIASFILSDNASVSVNEVLQESGITPNNYNDTLVYVVEAENGDTSHYNVTVNLITSINNLDDVNIKVYPNPANDYIFIENAASSNFKLFDCKGNQIVKSKINDRTNKISLKQLPPGVYIIQIDHLKGSFVKKIIIN